MDTEVSRYCIERLAKVLPFFVKYKINEIIKYENYLPMFTQKINIIEIYRFTYLKDKERI